MKLYNSKDDYRDAVIAASNYYRVSPAIVEKDYFVTIILERLKDRIPGILFKGGTSLSKCHKLINRFSEDIDLTLDLSHFTQGNKRNANKAILSVCDDLGFAVDNREQVEKHCHGNYNCYMIRYPAIFNKIEIKPYIKLEMTFIQRAYPDEYKPVCSLIGEFLLSQGQKDALAIYELTPYEIKVQALERTLVDKVFALCDYYLSKEVSRQSRHIYDLYKLINVIDLEKQTNLIRDVRNDRKPNRTCLSAQEGISINTVLTEIIDSAYYEQDYNEVTASLLSEDVDYNTAIQAIVKIVNSNVFE